MHAPKATVEFSEEELTALTRMLHSAWISGSTYTAGLSGIRKLIKALEELVNGNPKRTK